MTLCDSKQTAPHRLAYVVKRYPRFSETFVVNEILAHEAAGVSMNIFALRSPCDTHFQPAIADVRASVHYLNSANIRAAEFWSRLEPWLRRSPSTVGELARTAGPDGLEVFQAIELANAVVERGIEHMHAHFATSAASVTRMASLLTGVPYTFTAHAKDIYHESVDREDLRCKIAAAAAVVTVSEYNRNFLSNAYPEYAEKVVRVFNGLPLDKLPMRRPAMTPPCPPLLVAVGRLVEKKGFDDLIRACAVLRDSGHDFRCVIVGGGDLAAPLQRQINDCRLGEQLRLLGPMPSDEVVALLHQAAVLVAPCVTASTGDRDGMPTILLEAMACGAPCVATSVTGIPEIVEDRQTGLLVPERRPIELSAAIAELLSDRRLAQQLAYRARERIEQHFDALGNARVLRDIFANAQARLKPYAEAC